jgi:response regulator of citrate/malate metabolism
MGKNKDENIATETGKKERMTIEQGTNSVMAYLRANPARADTESIAKGIGVSNATAKRYTEMLCFGEAAKLDKHTGRTYFSIRK